MTNNNKKNVKPIGFNLTGSLKVRLYKIADFFKCNRTDTVKKIFDILFERMSNDQEFIAYCEACDKTRSLKSGDKIVYTSFLIPGYYMERFEDLMDKSGFIDRSLFLGLVIDYVYDHNVKPAEEGIIP